MFQTGMLYLYQAVKECLAHGLRVWPLSARIFIFAPLQGQPPAAKRGSRKGRHAPPGDIH